MTTMTTTTTEVCGCYADDATTTTTTTTMIFLRLPTLRAPEMPPPQSHAPAALQGDQTLTTLAQTGANAICLLKVEQSASGKERVKVKVQ
jgi:hypothetical protein